MSFVQFTLFVIIFHSLAISSDYIIETFCNSEQRTPPSTNDVITAPEGDKLVVVDVYYNVRPGELIMRRCFNDGEYGIYKGNITPEAAAGSLELNKFDFPEGMDMTMALHTKFYNSKSASPENDIKSVFFNDFGIYVDLALKIYYNSDGNWHELAGKKSTLLGERKELSTPTVISGSELSANGKWTGEIQWLTLNSINKVEGTLKGSRIWFKETGYIKKGNAILGCMYTLDLNEDEARLDGTWEDISQKGEVTIDLPKGSDWSKKGGFELLSGLYTLSGVAKGRNGTWPFWLRITSFDQSEDKINQSYQEPETKLTKKRESKQNTDKGSGGFGFAWVGSFLTGSVNTHPDTIFAHGTVDSIVSANYSALRAPSMANGFSVYYYFSCTPQIRLMFEGLYSQTVKFNSGVIDISYKIPLTKNKLSLPVGIGISVGGIHYKWDNAKLYESMARSIPLTKATTDGDVSRTEFGITGCCGLNYRIGYSKVHLFSEAWYQFDIDPGTWKLSYKTGAKDSNGNDETKEIDIPERYLPYNNLKWTGLKIRAGITIGD
jgi:hypothetical protein